MKKTNQYKPPKVGAPKYNGKKNRYRQIDWVEYRMKFLKHNPKCYCCGEIARVVDHLEAHKGDEALFKKWDNFLPMCKPCHSTITALFDRHAEVNMEGKLRWIARKRSETETTVTVKVVAYSL